MTATATLNSEQVKSDNPQTAATHMSTLDCVQQYMKLLLSFAYITTHAHIIAVYTISTTCTFVWKTLELYSVLYQLSLQVFASNRWLYILSSDQTPVLHHILVGPILAVCMCRGRDRESRPQLTQHAGIHRCTHTHTHIHTHLHTHTHTCTHVHTHRNTHAYTETQTFTYMQKHKHTCTW